jgi:L-lactate dehydrogenase complex protein LldG
MNTPRRSSSPPLRSSVEQRRGDPKTSAREEILRRVRSALSGVSADVDVRPAPRAPDRGDLVALFEERVSDYRAIVTRCAADEVEAVVADVLGAARAVVPAGLGLEVPGAVADDGFSAAELDGYDAVVTRAAVGIAETGTIVLDHGPDQGRRAISLVPDLHVCVVAADQVVADVPDAIALLDPARPLTWISGPSATSDIELDRVEGVHGPRTLRVVLVG